VSYGGRLGTASVPKEMCNPASPEYAGPYGVATGKALELLSNTAEQQQDNHNNQNQS
jgi:hypothetical protein